MKKPQLSDCLPPERAFYVSRSMLKNRLDAEFFQPKHYRLLEEMYVSGGQVLVLRKIAKRIVDGPFGSAIKAADYTDEGIPFLRVADVTRGEGTIKTKGLAFISHEAHKRILRSRVLPGDVVVAKTGATMGAASLIPSSLPEANIRADLAGITLKDPTRAQYLVNFINTRMGYQLFWRLNSGATRGRVVIENLKEYPILWPSDEICKEVNLLVDQARQAKKRKEAVAKDLLATIDDVLLDELGIPHKPEPPNTLENRIFRRHFSSVSGKRIDPAANWKCLSFDGGMFPLRRLSDVVAINPITRFPKLEATTPVSFVPMDAVSDVFGEIADFQTRPIGESGSYTLFQEGDIIWAKITPCMENGKSAVARNLREGIGYGSTEFHVFRRKTNELCPEYLHHLLRLNMVRQHARLNFTGSSGHQRVDENFFYRLEIPFPHLRIQEHIVEKAEATKAKAKALYAEARSDLEKAKRDIEALILGKEGGE